MLLLVVVALVPGCGGGSEGSAARPESTVVLYSSADPDAAKPVIAAFEKESGIRVLLVGDTEATKTTGLVQRLLAEKDKPRADVWWSSEPFGTIRLAKEGVLEKYTSAAAEASIEGGWPETLRAKDGTWYGFAQRARVIIYNTEHVKAGDVPRTLGNLVEAKYKDRVGMARPQFGTTGGQMIAICHIYGPDSLRNWLKALKANGLRLYDGNAAVARAVGQGEVFVGIADTDDVYAAKRNNWPVEMVFEPNDMSDPKASFGGFGTGAALKTGAGPLVVPNTAALVKGAPNAENAKKLIDFLLSEKCERILAESDSHNIPAHPKLREEFERYAPKTAPMTKDFEWANMSADMAAKICGEELR